MNAENRIAVCALPTIELGNGYGRERDKGKGTRPNRPNEHPQRREKEVEVPGWGYRGYMMLEFM